MTIEKYGSVTVSKDPETGKPLITVEGFRVQVGDVEENNPNELTPLQWLQCEAILWAYQAIVDAFPTA